MIPYDLRTNARREPLEIDETHPWFAWRLRSETYAECATYELVVTAEPQPAHPDGFRWSSGVVPSDAVQHRYDGPALRPRSFYTWTVTTTDDTGSTGTATSRFETGLQDDTWAELGASWISRNAAPWFDSDGESLDPGLATPLPRTWRTMYSGAPLQLRRAFRVETPAIRARLYISARGIHRAHVNGLRAGDDELAPGWTRYESRIEYQAYDVTDALRDGENVLAVQVADGWWSGYLGYNARSQADQYGHRPELICALEILHANGTTTVISSDTQWRERSGSIVMADLLMGEYHDHASCTAGWREPAFDDSSWRNAVVSGADTGMLRAQSAPPVRVIDERTPVGITVTEAGTTVVDFGQNLVGRVRLDLTGQRAGSVVELLHGEMLDGTRVYRANLRTAEARDLVVASGEDETFEPVFTVHGFRYLEIVGLDRPLDPTQVTAVVLSTDVPRAGAFSTSSALVNQIYSNISWGQSGNFVAVPTDCPQRDERLGWTADTQIFAPTASYNSDVHAFLTRWLDDLRASQRPSGVVPDVVPAPPTSHNFDIGAPGWGDAAVIVPWHLYRVYGDRELLERHYPSMQAWVEWVASQNPDGLWTNAVGNNYGDWLSVDADTSRPLVAAAYRIRSTDLIADAASALGRFQDARHHRAEARRLRVLFEETFLEESGRLCGHTQTAYLFALAWRLVDDRHRDSLSAHLVRDLESRGARLTTGFLGVSLLCPTLVDINRPDLAYALLFQEEFPSWGYSIRHGATTIWERWDGWTEHAGFQTVEMNSFNHYSLGSVGEWLYRHVAGIEQAEDSVGFRRLRIAPQFTDRFDHVRASYESVRGLIEVGWTRDESGYHLDVVLPPGSSADVILPNQSHHGVAGRTNFTVSADAADTEAKVVPA
ncbi:alpha-L-rhamnosidase [Microbacterium saperdae]|uniref:alpha-L-rhamnosidase n=1 Tax=Microbacterium saperdae TaxID=69368 RepID=A0A543BLB1_9MICO|nr:alpha-L-rhamnosidase [Microbacterium saperdae]TQL85625.1 alpha-L-rhamnosidase [Microbacterium saperdae]GGM62121.1 alpha-L-rhamnosidase [Microbacterium saperdae]